MEKQQIIRLAEAASQLGVSPKTARSYIRNGTLPAFRLGKDWFVYAYELEATIRNQIAKNESADRRIARLVRENISTIESALIVLSYNPLYADYTDMDQAAMVRLANQLRAIVENENG